jgi:NAD(P) transhydrogenase subunit beta
MSVIEGGQVRQVFVLKRSYGGGYGGMANALFELLQTAMVFGDVTALYNGLHCELRSMAVGKVEVTA